MSTQAWISYLLFASGCIGAFTRTLGKWTVVAAWVLSLLFLIADTGCFCRRIIAYEVPNPYRVPQLQVLVALLGVGAWWRRVRPRPRMPRVATHLAGLTVAGAVGQLWNAHIGWLAISSGGLLIACLLLDLRMHRPPIAPAMVRPR